MSDGNGSGSAIPDGLVTKIEAQLVATIWSCGAKALGSAPFDPRWVLNPRVRKIVQGALELDGDGVEYTPEQLIARVPGLVDHLDWVSKLVDETIGLSTPDELVKNLPLLEQAWRLRQLKIAGSDLVRQPENPAVVDRVKALLDRPMVSSDDDYIVGNDIGLYLGDDEPSEDTSDDWIVDGLIPSSAPSAIAGEPKSGKTILAEEIAICVAAGLPFMGHPVRQGKVILFPFEDPRKVTMRRLWMIARAHDLDPRSLTGRLVVSDSSLGFDDRVEVEKLRRSLERFGPCLMIIDSLSRIHSGDENSKKDMGPVHKVWGDLAREYQAAVTIIHHFAKTMGSGQDNRSAGQRMRGSSDIHALVRQVVGVFGPEDDPIKTIACSGNLQGKPKPFLAELIEGTNERGKKTLSWAHRGSAKEYRDTKIREAVISALTANEDGLSVRKVRSAVKDILGMVTPAHVDASLRQLKLEGRVDQAVGKVNGQSRPYRLINNSRVN